MGRGRPIKPLEDKIADGSFRADRANLSAPQPNDFDPENPFDIGTIAWMTWDYIVPELMECYSVGKADRAIVEGYCRNYQMALDAEKEYGGQMTYMNENGDIKAHPAVKIAQSAWGIVARFGGLLGITPADRPKIKGAKQRAGAGPALSLLHFSRDRSKGPGAPPEVDEQDDESTGDDMSDAG